MAQVIRLQFQTDREGILRHWLQNPFNDDEYTGKHDTEEELSSQD